MPKKRAKPKARIATKGKPGLKQCPSCKKYVGPRTQVCECGHGFKRKKRVAKKKAVGKPPAFLPGRTRADPCFAPVRLSSHPRHRR